MFASENDHSDVIQILLEENIDPNIQKEDGWTTLMSASMNGHSEAVEILLEGCADINIQRATALMFSSLKGHSQVVNTQLLKGWSDLDIRDEKGQTTLGWPFRMVIQK